MFLWLETTFNSVEGSVVFCVFQSGVNDIIRLLLHDEKICIRFVVSACFDIILHPFIVFLCSFHKNSVQHASKVPAKIAPISHWSTSTKTWTISTSHRWPAATKRNWTSHSTITATRKSCCQTRNRTNTIRPSRRQTQRSKRSRCGTNSTSKAPRWSSRRRAVACFPPFRCASAAWTPRRATLWWWTLCPSMINDIATRFTGTYTCCLLATQVWIGLFGA